MIYVSISSPCYCAGAFQRGNIGLEPPLLKCSIQGTLYNLIRGRLFPISLSDTKSTRE